MAKLPHYPEDPQRQAHETERWTLQTGKGQGEVAVATIRYALKENPWFWFLAVPTLVAAAMPLLSACTRSSSGGVIPTAEASDTPSPSDTPTGTAEPTGTHTATAAWTATHGSTATELLVAPSTTSAAADASPTVEGDSTFPGFDLFDANHNGDIEPGEMPAAARAVAEWVISETKSFAENGTASPMAEKLAHLFGHTDVSLRAELVVSSDKPAIDLPWMADADIGRDGVTTAAEHLYWRSGVGVLTTGEGLNNMLEVLAPQIHVAGQLLDDPDSKVTSFADVEKALANSLGVDSEPRVGIQPSPAGELGLNKDLCLNVAFDEGSGQDRPTLNIPVVVEATVKPGNEFMDTEKRIHVSNKSAIAVVLRVVENGELPAIQQLLRAEGDAATVTKLSPNYSLVTEAFLLENNPQIEGSQLLSCGRPAQSGAQPTATPSPSATPTATETPRPQGGPGPGPEQPSLTPVIPSATQRPAETPLPPTNTPVVPSATPRPDASNTPIPTATHTSEPPPTAPATSTPEVPPTLWPTVTEPVHTKTPAPPETPKATLTPLPTPENSPTPSAPN